MIRYGNASTPLERRKKVLNALDPTIVTTTGRINVKALEAKYQKDGDIMTEQPEKFRKVIDIINTLPKADKAIILLYIELNNKSAVAELLGVSGSSAGKEIRRILDYINRRLQNNNNG